MKYNSTIGSNSSRDAKGSTAAVSGVSTAPLLGWKSADLVNSWQIDEQHRPALRNCYGFFSRRVPPPRTALLICYAKNKLATFFVWEKRNKLTLTPHPHVLVVHLHVQTVVPPLLHGPSVSLGFDLFVGLDIFYI